MKNYARTITLGLFALLEATGCGGSVSSGPPADGGGADGAGTAADSAIPAADSASRPDAAIGDETIPAADAMHPPPSTDATLADASAGDATTPSIDATPPPDGTPAEDSTSSDDSAMNEGDAAMNEGDSAVGEGGSCEGFTTENPTCDQCIGANCCSAVAACNAGDDSGADNAGATMCEQILSCVEDACADGGVLGECIIGCSPDEVSPVDPLLTCVATSCPTECN